MKLSYIFVIMILGIAMPLLGQAPWQSVTAADVTLEYRVTADANNLECKLSGETTGWVAVGFNPTTVMRNANIIIGYVSGANIQIRDDWGTSNTSHASDTSLGGSSDVTLINGTEAAGNTMLHFTIPLATTDQYDRPLIVGQSYPIILARGANNADNYTGMHADADYAQITLTAPVSNSDLHNGVSFANRILGNYPNPFNPQTTISYYLEKPVAIQIIIYNLRGQIVYSSNFEKRNAGFGSFVWDGRDSFGRNAASGSYRVRLISPEGYSEHRITLMK